MAGPGFNIGVSIGHLIPDGAPVSRELFPSLSRAVGKVVQETHGLWVGYASGHQSLPNGHRLQSRSGSYARSIRTRRNGDFAGEVYSDLPLARAIEYGTPQRDQKKILGSSLKVRVSADGKRYLIIPFRWDTPGSVKGGNHMTQAVHDWWQDPVRERSSITGGYARLSGTGALHLKTRQPLTVPGRRYDWGTRLGKDDLASMGVAEKAASRMAGMVNFRRPGKTGGAAQSQYLTFRVMSEDSPGWIQPARPGRYVARTTAEQMQQFARLAIEAGIRRDIERFLSGG